MIEPLVKSIDNLDGFYTLSSHSGIGNAYVLFKLKVKSRVELLMNLYDEAHSLYANNFKHKLTHVCLFDYGEWDNCTACAGLYGEFRFEYNLEDTNAFRQFIQNLSGHIDAGVMSGFLVQIDTSMNEDVDILAKAMECYKGINVVSTYDHHRQGSSSTRGVVISFEDLPHLEDMTYVYRRAVKSLSADLDSQSTLIRNFMGYASWGLSQGLYAQFEITYSPHQRFVIDEFCEAVAKQLTEGGDKENERTSD